ncbi:MAG TPA: hypothetical protein VHF90_03050 [Thermoleophilaceae bacterium]|nr:hypothetical protein [Thermoleophilaceae bacterium]
MRLSTAISLVLLTATCVPAAASASHKPGHTPGPPSPGESLTIGAEPSPVVYGGIVLISGRLTSPVRAGKSIVLESDRFPYDGFAPAGNVTTGPSGNYSFTERPGANVRYRVRQGNLLSPVTTVLVRIRVGMRVSDRTPERGERVRFFGRACPQHAGALVRIQLRLPGRWTTVARTRTGEATRCSSYSRRLRVFADDRYRVVVAGDEDHARGISRSRFLDVVR